MAELDELHEAAGTALNVLRRLIGDNPQQGMREPNGGSIFEQIQGGDWDEDLTANGTAGDALLLLRGIAAEAKRVRVALDELRDEEGAAIRGNADAVLTGEQIALHHVRQETGRPYQAMGRVGGLHGAALARDIASEAWRGRAYQVRIEAELPNSNWFPIQSFLDRLRPPGGP